MSKSNFIIITHPRSGAHLIISLLNSHPEIECVDEVFNKLNADECNLHYQKYLNSEQNITQIKGFKIPYHFWNTKKNDIWIKAKNNPEFKIIHLSRSNLIRAYVSYEIAEKTKVWYGKKEQPKLIDKKIIIDPKHCLQWMNQTIHQQKISEYEFRYHISFTLTYENFLFDNNKSIEMLKFLDVDTHHQLTTRMKKQNPEPLHQLIINYDEFENSIRKSRWSVFLDDDNSLRINQNTE